MVKTRHYFVFLSLYLILSCASPTWAITLKAEAERTEIALNQTVALTLTLEGAASAGTPDFTVLENDFRIVSRGQSSSFSFVNGVSSSQVIWNLVLQPLHEGDIVIPALSVQTDQGVISSEPLKLSVTKTANNSYIPKNKQGRDVYIHAAVSNRAPYQNSPLIFSVRLVAAAGVSDISFGDFKIDGAVVEKQGEPVVYDEVQGSRAVKIIELRYLITPLQDGPLKIPPFVFQGMIRAAARNTSPYGGSSQDPFEILQDLSLLTSVMGQPFTLSSDEIIVNVKKAPVRMDPWLPAEDLKISDALQGVDNAKVGEPFYRRLTLVAKGNVGTILPDLNGKVAPESDFRIYAETPQTGVSLSQDGKDVSGWREEIYTLIPQNAGTLTLPEIRVPWWDLKSNKVAYATVPARTIKVASGSPSQNTAAGTPASDVQKKVRYADAQSAAGNIGSLQLLTRDTYVFGGLIAAATLGAVLYFYFSYSKKGYATKTKVHQNGTERNADAVHRPIPQPANEDNISAADLRKAGTLDELKKMIVTFAAQKAGTRPAASLKDIAEVISEGLENDERERTKKLFARLEAALYAGEEIPFAPLREDFATIIEQYNPPKRNQTAKIDRLGALNPS